MFGNEFVGRVLHECDHIFHRRDVEYIILQSGDHVGEVRNESTCDHTVAGNTGIDNGNGKPCFIDSALQRIPVTCVGINCPRSLREAEWVEEPRMSPTA